MKNSSTGGTVVVFILAVIGLMAAFQLFNNYIYQQEQKGHPIEAYRATLSGEYVCLPHVDTSGPQTDECAFGLLTAVGEYYALDFNLMSQIPAELSTGTRISAAGVVTPLELLSTDHWRKYPIEGIFSVTDSLKILGEDTPRLSEIGAFYKSALACEPATITRTQNTIEGDPITTRATVEKVTGGCRISVYVDNSQDRFAGEGITNTLCQNIKLEDLKDGSGSILIIDQCQTGGTYELRN